MTGPRSSYGSSGRGRVKVFFIEGGVVDGDFSGAGVLEGVRTATGAVDEAVEGLFSFLAGFECGFSLFLGGSIKPVTCSR